MTDEAGPRSGGRPAVFLDRDGVINVDRGYVSRIEDFEFLPGIFDLARFVRFELGWPVIVVSNQSGIGRGYFDEAAYGRLTEWMCERFRVEGAPLMHVYHCPYHPTEGIGAYRVDHDWRKPKPGMILQAAVEFDIDLSRSALIGDKIEDIQAAVAAGVPVRIRIGRGGPATAEPPHEVVGDLWEAISRLRAEAIRTRSPGHGRI